MKITTTLQKKFEVLEKQLGEYKTKEKNLIQFCNKKENEWKLLEKLQTIKYKLDNLIELTDDDYKLFTIILFGVAFGILNYSVDILLKVIPCDDDELKKLYDKGSV